MPKSAHGASAGEQWDDDDLTCLKMSAGVGKREGEFFEQVLLDHPFNPLAQVLSCGILSTDDQPRSFEPALPRLWTPVSQSAPAGRCLRDLSALRPERSIEHVWLCTANLSSNGFADAASCR
jgi:hypothetical protein